MNFRLPDVYIIGAQKSGTTTLFDWIAQHPQVHTHPVAKDHPYFSNDVTYQDGVGIFREFAEGAGEDQVLLGGEANAMYAAKGPSRLAETIPNAKLIVIIRNPIDRAFSAYCYAKERVLEERTFAQAIEEEMNGKVYDHQLALQLDYLAHGHYARQLTQIYEYYDREKVKVVLFEQLKNNPDEVLNDIFEFIGIDLAFNPDKAVKNKTMGGYRSKVLAKLARTHPETAIIRNLGKKITSHALRAKVRQTLDKFNRVEKARETFPEDVKRKLYQYFKAEVEDLEKLLNTSLPDWK